MRRKIRTCRRKISKKNQQEKESRRRKISNEIGTGYTRRDDRAAKGTAETPKTNTGNKIRMRLKSERAAERSRRKISKRRIPKKNQQRNRNRQHQERRQILRTHKGKFTNRHQTSSVAHTQPESGCYRAALVELPESPRVPAKTGLTHLISML